jgi:hypothetical protein
VGPVSKFERKFLKLSGVYILAGVEPNARVVCDNLDFNSCSERRGEVDVTVHSVLRGAPPTAIFVAGCLSDGEVISGFSTAGT